MKIWSVSNQKGGVGKTTTALTLAGLAAEQGLRTLLVDLDPHASLTAYFRLEPDALKYSSFTLFTQRDELNELSVRRAIVELNDSKLSLLPASPALASIDRQPAGRDGMGLVLQRALACVQSAYDLVIVDGPPMVGVLMVNTILTAEQLIIPVQTEFLALQGLARMLKTLSLFESQDRVCRSYLIIPTLYDRRTQASLHSLQTLRTTYGESVWSGQITMDTKFRDAMESGVLPHQLHEESSGVSAYRLLLENLLSGVCGKTIRLSGGQ